MEIIFSVFLCSLDQTTAPTQHVVTGVSMTNDSIGWAIYYTVGSVSQQRPFLMETKNRGLNI